MDEISTADHQRDRSNLQTWVVQVECAKLNLYTTGLAPRSLVLLLRWRGKENGMGQRKVEMA